MRRSTAERLARLYPGAWRSRFGEEFVDFLEIEPFGVGVVWDVARAAMNEHVLNLTAKEARVAYSANVRVLVGQPSGYIPMLFSSVALGAALFGIASTAGARQADEGVAAHVFQLLIVAQVPIIAYFVIRWARGRSWATLTVVAGQVLAIASAMAPVWFFHL